MATYQEEQNAVGCGRFGTVRYWCYAVFLMPKLDTVLLLVENTCQLLRYRMFRGMHAYREDMEDEP